VPYDDIVKGYEISPGHHVVITQEELESLDPKKTRTIDIQDFVELEEIDPIYYDAAYYLVPDKGADKAYNLLLQAMKESGRVAVARVVIRTKEHLTAIRATDDVLTMATMLFSDEVVPADRLDEQADAGDGASKRELDMARQLIESLSTEFEPDKYRDEYRERVLDMIERKAEGEEIAVQPAEEPERVPDLMAALEASIKAAGQDGDEAEKKSDTRASSSNGRKSRSSKSKSGGSSRGGSKSGGKRSKAKSSS
jgi:DNA end-binding protein Ku